MELLPIRSHKVFAVHSLSTLIIVLLITSACSQQPSGEVGKGREHFSKMCAHCHGVDAAGDGPEHTEYIPNPANLTLIRDTLPMVGSIVHNGIPGTAMPAFPEVDEQAINDIGSFFTSRPPNTNREWARPWRVDERMVSLELAEKIYTTTCHGCHGPDGLGNGDWAVGNPYVWPKPANFHARNSELGRLYYIISYGREGTFMPPQVDTMPDFVRLSLAHLAYSLFNPNSDATIPAGETKEHNNPYTRQNMEIVRLGERHYQLQCVSCHGPEAGGTFLAPRHTDRKWYYGGGSDNALFVMLTQGAPGKLMPSYSPLEPDMRWALVTYLRHRGGLPDPLSGKAEEHETENHEH